MQRALPLHHVPDVVVVRDDDTGPERVDDVLGHPEAHDMLRTVHGQERDVDAPERLPDLRRRVVPVVPPVKDAQPAGLDRNRAIVPGTGIVRRLDARSAERRMDFLEIVERCARVRSVLVRNAAYDDIGELIPADRPVQQHMRIQPV